MLYYFTSVSLCNHHLMISDTAAILPYSICFLFFWSIWWGGNAINETAENYAHCSWFPTGNEVWGKVLFSVMCVKNSIHRGRSASVHAGIPTPPSRHSPNQAPQEQTPLGPGTPLPGADIPTPWTWHPLDLAPPGPGTPWTWHPLDLAPPGPGTPWTWHPLDQAPGGCLSACWDTTPQSRPPQD